MLINNADLLHNQKKLSNCRIQSLCDLLVVNKYHVNPSLMYLSCLDTLLSYAEIRQNHIDLPLLSCFYDDIEASTQGTAITDKVFALKIKMLRKSMISGTTTVNRNEIADGLEAFNEVNPSSRLRNLADGFKESAKNYRNIVRYLSTVDNYITRKVEFMDKVIADFYHAFQYESEILESFMK